MTAEHILIVVLVGAIAGWLAGLVTRGSGYGLIGDVIVGLIGAAFGSWLFRTLGIAPRLGNAWLEWGFAAFVGAVVLLIIWAMLRPRSVGERIGDVFRRR